MIMEELIRAAEGAASDGADLLRPLLHRPETSSRTNAEGLVIGRLLALIEEGRTPLVCYPDQPGAAALKARSTTDLHAAHIGAEVVLGFERNDPTRPIILGLLQDKAVWSPPDHAGDVVLDKDGKRMIVTAEYELVLRCGKSSVSLRCDGRVEIRGDTVLTQADGANRIRGGSVEMN